MAVEYYDMRHEGEQIDDAVDLVLTGDIIKNNTSNTVDKGEELPVSGDAVFKAIEANGDALNAKIVNLYEDVDGKVDKVDGKGLSTNDYDNEAKAEVAKVKDKQDKLVVSTLGNGNIKVEGLGEFMAATPSGNPNHNLYISLGATWSDAGWELNGVPLTNEEIDVSYLCSVPYLHRMQEGAWGNMKSYFINLFKTNFCSLLGVAYNSSQRAFNADSIGYAARQLQVVRFQNFRNETSYKVFIKNPQYMFGSCSNLREIQDYLDVSLCTSFTQSFGARATSLETIWLIGLNADLDISGTKVFKKECLVYMIRKAAPTKAITIKVNADVWAWASTDAEVIAALAAQPLVTLIPA